MRASNACYCVHREWAVYVFLAILTENMTNWTVIGQENRVIGSVILFEGFSFSSQHPHWKVFP